MHHTAKRLAVFCSGALALGIAVSCTDSPRPTESSERVETTSSALLSSAWTPTVSMNLARQNHVAAQLQNGSLLVAGGHPGNNVPTSSAEVYSPATGAWTTVGSMGTARRLFGACTLSNGKVLVAGGNGGAGDVASAELFDPSTNAWSTTGSLASAREDFSTTCLSDGRVLVAGGSGPSGLLSSAEVYNPTSGTWSSAGTMPAAVHTQGAALLSDGRVLVAGGNNASGPVGTAAIWSPSTNAWAVTGSLATARAFFALNGLGDGRVLASGGLVNVLLATTNTAEIYSPTTGTWSAVAHLNTARYGGVSATLSAGPIVVGGVNGGSPLATSESYDSVHNTWTQVATAYGAVNQTATALSSTSVIVAGGNTGSNATTSAQTFGLLNVFALYAQRSVTLGSSDHVNGGDVGVAALAASGFGTQLVVGSSTTVQTNHNLVAPSVSLASGAHVGDVQTDSLTNSGGTLGTSASYPAATMPAPPLALPTGPGGSSVTVPAFTVTTLNPGDYGALSVTGTVYLNAGAYTFSSVTMANQAHLAGVSGTATVAVTGTFQAGNSVSISSPGATPAGQLVISVAGYDSGATHAFSIGTGAAISAILSGPHGTLSIGASSIATGAFAGYDIALGSGVTINYQDGFPPAASMAGRQAVSSYHLPPPSPIVGPVPPGTVLTLAVGLPIRNFSNLQAIADAAADPNSASYRHFLGPTDYASTYAPLTGDYSNLATWARSKGFTVGTYPTNTLIDITATAAQLESAFLVNLNYASRSDGSVFYGPDRVPTLGLTLQVLGISGVDNYVAPVLMGGGACSSITSGPACPAGSLTASDIRGDIVNATPGCTTLTGQGQSIGIFAYSGFNQSDICQYEVTNGLSNTPDVKVQTSNDPNGLSAGCPACSGTTAPPLSPDGEAAGVECAVDIEMALSMAPQAQVIVFQGTNPDSILANMAANPGVSQLSSSISFGASGLTQTLLTVLAAQGQSYFTSSGDSGAYQAHSATCTSSSTPPTDSVSLQYVTAVGGSTLAKSGVESGWQGSGGGVLPGVSIPLYQKNVNNGIVGSDPSVSNTNRNLPDVALVAQNVCQVVTNCSNQFGGAVGSVLNSCPAGNTCTPAPGSPGKFVLQACPATAQTSGQAATLPGTSVSSPMWAGFMALVNEQLGAAGPVGFANPSLYNVKSGTGAITDIVDGSVNTNTCGGFFSAQTGYDLVTGLGTPSCRLVQQLQGPPTLTLGVSGTAEGPMLCLNGSRFTPGGTATVTFSGLPGSARGGGGTGCPVTTTPFLSALTIASDGTLVLTDNEISDVENQVRAGIPCCTPAEVANGTVSINVVDNTTGISATAAAPARFWCETNQTSTAVGLAASQVGPGCQPVPVTISYQQSAECDGDQAASPNYDTGSGRAFVIFRIEYIDNSLESKVFHFDQSQLLVRQPLQDDFFDSSLGVYSDLLQSNAITNNDLPAGDFMNFSGAFGALVVCTTDSTGHCTGSGDGAAAASQVSWVLDYNQAVTDPPVVLDAVDRTTQSELVIDDCANLSPLQ